MHIHAYVYNYIYIHILVGSRFKIGSFQQLKLQLYDSSWTRVSSGLQQAAQSELREKVQITMTEELGKRVYVMSTSTYILGGYISTVAGRQRNWFITFRDSDMVMLDMAPPSFIVMVAPKSFLHVSVYVYMYTAIMLCVGTHGMCMYACRHICLYIIYACACRYFNDARAVYEVGRCCGMA